jgi:hypothetical protein
MNDNNTVFLQLKALHTTEKMRELMRKQRDMIDTFIGNADKNELNLHVEELRAFVGLTVQTTSTVVELLTLCTELAAAEKERADTPPTTIS